MTARTRETHRLSAAAEPGKVDPWFEWTLTRPGYPVVLRCTGGVIREVIVAGAELPLDPARELHVVSRLLAQGDKVRVTVAAQQQWVEAELVLMFDEPAGTLN